MALPDEVRELLEARNFAHLASDVSRVFRRPASFIQAACMTRSFDVS